VIAALLLAAGASRRMGRSKLQLDLKGRSVLERAVDGLLASPVELVLVIVAPGASGAPLDRSDSRLRVLSNPQPEEGMASSIRVGMKALPREVRALLLALADKPLVRPETVTAVVERFEATAAAIVYPTYQGRQGHPVLVAPALFAALSGLQGDVGAKSLLRKYAAQSAAVECDDPGVLLDIDTPGDYAKAQKLLESGEVS